MSFFRALPPAWLDPMSSALGLVVYAIDRRGRRVGMQNLDVILGDERTRREKRRILRTSTRESVRSIMVLLHAAPLTPDRFRKWVDVPDEVEQTIREAGRQVKGAVIVSAHLGSWEMLLGLSAVFRDIMPVMFLVEASFHPAINRFLADIRGTGGGESAASAGGAADLDRHIRRGGAAGLVVDRNVRQNKGGIWAPFFGLSSLTTPLPAVLARGHDIPVVPIFCLPTEHGRYRIRLGTECAMDVRSGDLDADILEITTRISRQVEALILERPESWNWTLKRFKSRPVKEQGAYPPYSRLEQVRGE